MKIEALNRYQLRQEAVKAVLPEGCYLVHIIRVESDWFKAAMPTNLNIYAGFRNIGKILRDNYIDNAAKLSAIDSFVDTLYTVRYNVSCDNPNYFKSHKTEEEALADKQALDAANLETPDYSSVIMPTVVYATAAMPLPYGYVELVAVRNNFKPEDRLNKYRKLYLTTFNDNGEIRVYGEGPKSHVDVYGYFPVLIGKLHPTMQQFDNENLGPYMNLSSLGISELFGEQRIPITNDKVYNAIAGNYGEECAEDLSNLIGKNIVQYRYQYLRGNGQIEYDWRFLPKYGREDIPTISFTDVYRPRKH